MKRTVWLALTLDSALLAIAVWTGGRSRREDREGDLSGVRRPRTGHGLSARLVALAILGDGQRPELREANALLPRL
jgi:hypothetical protein